MNQSKYVVGLYRDPSRRRGPEGLFFQEITAVVFDPAISHDAMEMLFLGIYSAGFCRLDPTLGKVFCFGRSESLNLESAPDIDEYFLAKALKLNLPSETPPLTNDELSSVLRDRRKGNFSPRR